MRTVQWGRTGPKACNVNHSMCVNVYAGITLYGVTECHLVTGTSKHKSTFTNRRGRYV